jgi:predicted PurR-regulated permease PerM
MFANLEGNSFSIETITKSLQENLLNTKVAGFSLDTLTSQMDKVLAVVGGFLTTLLSSSGNMLLNLALGTIFSYFMIAYYEDMRKIIMKELEAAERTKWRKIADRAPKIIRSYLAGMLMVMAILAVLNGIALMIIGLDYAFVWGFIIGLLAIIPYVGTFIGLMLPLTYSFISTNDYTQPLVILLVFLFIQQIEGNFITPKIVGDKLEINPFIIILMILIFGNIWGLDGIIISLPLIGVVKTILQEYERGQLWAKIISNKD